MIKKVALTVLVAFCIATFILTGCNTLHGVGKDIEGAGKAIKKASDKK